MTVLSQLHTGYMTLFCPDCTLATWLSCPDYTLATWPCPVPTTHWLHDLVLSQLHTGYMTVLSRLHSGYISLFCPDYTLATYPCSVPSTHWLHDLVLSRLHTDYLTLSRLHTGYMTVLTTHWLHLFCLDYTLATWLSRLHTGYICSVSTTHWLYDFVLSRNQCRCLEQVFFVLFTQSNSNVNFVGIFFRDILLDSVFDFVQKMVAIEYWWRFTFYKAVWTQYEAEVDFCISISPRCKLHFDWAFKTSHLRLLACSSGRRCPVSSALWVKTEDKIRWSLLSYQWE